IPLIITADLSREKFTVSAIAGILYLGIFASAVCFYTWDIDRHFALTLIVIFSIIRSMFLRR
ncbi:MAG: hypothetical protein KBS43_05480, partial [Oscillospiraceae bacterium]|nr:hypothetical protein [Candidatus Limimonas coprohippi]